MLSTTENVSICFKAIEIKDAITLALLMTELKRCAIANKKAKIFTSLSPEEREKYCMQYFSNISICDSDADLYERMFNVLASLGFVTSTGEKIIEPITKEDLELK